MSCIQQAPPSVRISISALQFLQMRETCSHRTELKCCPRAVRLALMLFIEGPWDRVHQVIGQAHTILHRQGIVRIQTDIRVGSR